MNIDTEYGFSVEWEDGEYKRVNDYENLQCYELLGGKITDVAIVKEPAIDINFKITGDRTITGPIMIPNKRMLRINSEGKYYVYFSEKTINHLKSNYKKKCVKFGH